MGSRNAADVSWSIDSTHSMLRLLVVLHAHLPWVREPDHADFLEEDWLLEGWLECYLPLVDVMEAWLRDGVQARLTLSISPPLFEMLVDPLLQTRFEIRLERLIRWAYDAERASFGAERAAYRFHYRRFLRVAGLWAHYHGPGLLRALMTLSEAGLLELMTSAATHAYLPLWQSVPRFIDLQLGLGAAALHHHTGRKGGGVWLPECGFAPGLDAHMARAGFSYTFLDTHGIRCATPRPQADVYHPTAGDAGVFAFGRDPSTSAVVWSAESGYPGDPRYREFHRDLGWDAPRAEFGAVPRPIGIKPFAVTGRDVPLGRKIPYARMPALQAVQAHASDFVAKRMVQAAHLEALGLGAPVVVAPFDAELFGHWWFEGPEFLDAVVRSVARAPSVELVTARDVLTPGVAAERVQWAQSSWGRGGYAGVWLDAKTAALWPRLHRVARRFFALFDRYAGRGSRLDEVLVQLARELLLAASSDWPFQITEGTNSIYAQRRIDEHLACFDRLAERLSREEAGIVLQEDLCARDAFFAWLSIPDLQRAVGSGGV